MSRIGWHTPAFSGCSLDSTSKPHLKPKFLWIHRTVPLVKWILDSMTSFYHLSSQDLSFPWVSQAVCTIDVTYGANWYFSSNTLWALTKFVCIPVGTHSASCRAGNEYIVTVYRQFYLSIRIYSHLFFLTLVSPWFLLWTFGCNSALLEQLNYIPTPLI